MIDITSAARSLVSSFVRSFVRSFISFNFYNFTVGDRVIARWTNNLYYAGKIESITGRCRAYKVLFDDGDEMTYHPQDVSGMILNEVPSNIVFGQHVIATWKGGHKYFIGFVSEIDQQHRFKVRFDDNDEDWYEEHKLRLFPEAASPHEGQLISGILITIYLES